MFVIISYHIMLYIRLAGIRSPAPRSPTRPCKLARNPRAPCSYTCYFHLFKTFYMCEANLITPSCSCVKYMVTSGNMYYINLYLTFIYAPARARAHARARDPLRTHARPLHAPLWVALPV